MWRIRLISLWGGYDSIQVFSGHTVAGAVEPDEIRVLVAERIRMLASERGVTMIKLADFAGISRRSLHRVLAGEESLTIDRLAKIAAALDVHPRDLLNDDV